MSVWLLTGANGFVGRHALAMIGDADANAEVIVLGRRRPPGPAIHAFVAADLTDPAGLRAAVADLSPDYVIHTAGRTPPAANEDLYRSNFWATTYLLSALRSLARPTRVVLAGSAAELGPVAAEHLPVAEDYPADPIDAYGRSKLMATRYGLAEGSPLEVMAARIFNPIGPGTPPTQVLGAFAARLAEAGPDPLELPVGPLDTRRDFVDVRDVARALIGLALGGRAGTMYHVGTGESHTVESGLDLLISHSGRSAMIRQDDALPVRRGPADSRADIRRIAAEIGWEPRIRFEQSVRDLWQHACGRAPLNPWAATPAVSLPAARLPLTA